MHTHGQHVPNSVGAPRKKIRLPIRCLELESQNATCACDEARRAAEEEEYTRAPSLLTHLEELEEQPLYTTPTPSELECGTKLCPPRLSPSSQRDGFEISVIVGYKGCLTRLQSIYIQQTHLRIDHSSCSSLPTIRAHP
jgi:hypothetical protein